MCRAQSHEKSKCHVAFRGLRIPPDENIILLSQELRFFYAWGHHGSVWQGYLHSSKPEQGHMDPVSHWPNGKCEKVEESEECGKLGCDCSYQSLLLIFVFNFLTLQTSSQLSHREIFISSSHEITNHRP